MRRKLISEGMRVVTLGLSQGFVKSDGSISTQSDAGHGNYVVSEMIEGGNYFFIECNANYFVAYVSLYDQAGVLLNQKYMARGFKRYGQGHIFCFPVTKQNKMRIVMVYNTSTYTFGSSTSSEVQPEGAITPSEYIVHKFYYADLLYFKPASVSSEQYTKGKQRAFELATVLYDSDNGNRLGVYYSDQNETASRVGEEVSPYTYITAWHNPRSVLHTEDVKNHVSQYGITYVTSNTATCSLYYGTACSTFVAYIQGYRNPYQAGAWKVSSYFPGISTVTPNADYSNLNPLDTVVFPDHVAVILDIWRTADGSVAFIEFAESGSLPYEAYIGLYTPDMFSQLLAGQEASRGNYEIRRNASFGSLNPWSDSCIPKSIDSMVTPINYNEDVCTFAGDRVSFFWGNPIFINVQRERGWTALNVYKEVDSALQLIHTYDITDTTVYPSVPDSENHDWVDVDVSALFAYGGSNYGKFVAKASDGSTESEPTYFEVLATHVDASDVTTKSGSDYTLYKRILWSVKELYGAVEILTCEGNSGFTSDTYPSTRYFHPTKQFSIVQQDETLQHRGVRILGSYGQAKFRRAKKTETNLIGTSNITSNKYINPNTNSFENSTYQDIITIANPIVGDTYRFGYNRNLSKSYGPEAYAFYDSEDVIIGNAQAFYWPNRDNTPTEGQDVCWDIVIPPGCAKLCISSLKANKYKFIIHVDDPFFESNTAVPTLSGIEPIGNNGSIEF